MSLISLAKSGLSYSKTGLNYATKAAKVLIHESVGDGYSVISKARKSVGGGYTIFQNPKAKTKAGWDALKADIKTVANKPGLLAKAKAHYNIGVTAASAGKNLNPLQKLVAGSKGIASAIKDSVKTAYKSGAVKQMQKVFAKGGKITNATKVWGGIKGLAKPLCKAPFLYAATLAIFEGPKVYDAFKNGGFWAGLKEAGKVCAGVAVGGALGALGTAVGGPVVGALAFAAGEQVTRSILGDSESEEAETKEGEQDDLTQATANGVMEEDPDTQAIRDQLRSEVADMENEDKSENKEDAETSQTTSELPEKLEASDTSVQNQLTTNPYLQNNQTYYNQYTNPFGIDASTNIFQRFPMGYTFQYQGNGMGMMF